MLRVNWDMLGVDRDRLEVECGMLKVDTCM